MTGKLITIVVFVMSVFLYTIELVMFYGVNFGIIAIVVAVLAVMPYLASHGNRQVVTKEVWIIVVMTLLSFIAFYFGESATYIRPLTAFTVVAGAYFGVPVGYLCGIVSIMLFSGITHMEPSIVIQMLVIGVIGLMTGMLRRKITQSRLFASVYILFSSVLFSASGLLNLLWDSESGFELSGFTSLFIDAVPWYVVYALSDILLYHVIRFILGRKAERMKKRYKIFEYGHSK